MAVTRGFASRSEFPRRQEPASFNLDKIMEKLESAGASGR